ncbi:hypothetical protein EVAR_87068_1 [Eumeta japonica]|uniref:Uncharacterized protein n=1 Tax=Eumeta variegata TaxID=151549 RepID=A0A4C1VR19_EUMVA|nr:hypothetical protein EVAR_87068_1 [Eumeta japonica]
MTDGVRTLEPESEDGESLWDGIYSVIRETGRNRENVLLQANSEQVLGSGESATLLEETFFSGDQVDIDDPYHTELKRRTKENNAGLLSELRLRTFLKRFILKRPQASMGSSLTYVRRPSSGT